MGPPDLAQVALRPFWVAAVIGRNCARPATRFTIKRHEIPRAIIGIERWCQRVAQRSERLRMVPQADLQTARIGIARSGGMGRHQSRRRILDRGRKNRPPINVEGVGVPS